MNLALFLFHTSQSSDTDSIVGAILGISLMLWLIPFFMYLTLCFTIGYLAKQKGHTGMPWGLFAFFFTPLIGALFLAAAAQRPTEWSEGAAYSVRAASGEPFPARRGSFT